MSSAKDIYYLDSMAARQHGKHIMGQSVEYYEKMESELDALTLT